jgi:hypothetical protein
MTKIIAFAGRKQSGKTSCAWYIENLVFKNFQHNTKCKTYSFADPLKRDICINILGLTENQCYGTDNEKNTLTKISWKDLPNYDDSWLLNKDYDSSGLMTARQVMQFIGTNIFRKLKKDVWSSATIKKILQEKYNIALIADCRFPNEVESVKEVGGYVIKLTRNPYNSDHESETALDDTIYSRNNFDLVIDNTNLSIDQQNLEVYNFLKSKGILQL